MTAAEHDKTFLQRLTAPAVSDGGQGLRGLFAKITEKAAPKVDEHQGDGGWNPLIADVLGRKTSDDDNQADTAPPVQSNLDA